MNNATDREFYVRRYPLLASPGWERTGISYGTVKSPQWTHPYPVTHVSIEGFERIQEIVSSHTPWCQRLIVKTNLDCFCHPVHGRVIFTARTAWGVATSTIGNPTKSPDEIVNASKVHRPRLISEVLKKTFQYMEMGVIPLQRSPEKIEQFKAHDGVIYKGEQLESALSRLSRSIREKAPRFLDLNEYPVELSISDRQELHQQQLDWADRIGRGEVMTSTSMLLLDEILLSSN